MRPASLMAAVVGLLLMCSAALAGSPANGAGTKHHAKRPAHSVHRTPRVYDASNFPVHSTSRKANSFVPRPRAKVARPSSPRRASATRAAVTATRGSQAPSVRSSRAREEFRQDHPCPSTGWTTGSCPGYVIDDVKALQHGGADASPNMQWQSTEAARSQDRVE